MVCIRHKGTMEKNGEIKHMEMMRGRRFFPET